MTADSRRTAIIIVDHGSRRQASNEMLEAAARAYAERGEFEVVEAAHMELAEPTIATAFRRCVERGAGYVVVFPYFLSPGRHWTVDIPELVQRAAAAFPGVEWTVTAPFGLHPRMGDIISERIRESLSKH
ncbi:MAG: cobalamin biosynthesis protein CbiX [Planctomycetaceae bacterium]|nr:cobalamin biosynthesis protein CbiX [Planctomycetaceae bacterium]